MERFQSFDIIDGSRVPQLVLRENTVIDNEHMGTVVVESGTLTLRGVIKGSLSVASGSTVIIYGKQSGSVSVQHGGEVIVHGRINGSVALSHGSKLTVEDGGVLAGSLASNGLLVLRGTFGGVRSGNGRILIEGDGLVKDPEIRDGLHYYNFD